MRTYVQSWLLFDTKTIRGFIRLCQQNWKVAMALSTMPGLTEKLKGNN